MIGWLVNHSQKQQQQQQLNSNNNNNNNNSNGNNNNKQLSATAQIISGMLSPAGDDGNCVARCQNICSRSSASPSQQREDLDCQQVFGRKERRQEAVSKYQDKMSSNDHKTR
jgi:hypothetical protein